MQAETEIAELQEASLALMDKEKLASLLVIKTEHLLVMSRCHLPGNTMQPVLKEVQLIQAEIKRRDIQK
jgi:hypothetical protein